MQDRNRRTTGQPVRRRKKRRKTGVVGLVIMVVCLVAGGLLLYSEAEKRKVPPILTEPAVTILSSPAASLLVMEMPDVSSDATVTLEPTSLPSLATSPPANSSSISHGGSGQLDNSHLGTLTILGKRIKVKVGIDSATLKKNVGWMPTSSMPGNEGLCVVMGHRNQELRVMKDISANDIVTIETQDGQVHIYSVYAAEILPSMDDLRFDDVGGRELRIVTCYPFYYQGNAPQKFVLKAVGV